MNVRVSLFLLALALVEISSTSGQPAAIPTGKFIGTFSNGVAVEFVGIGMHPSTKADWWQPDGLPLAERPYTKTIAYMMPGPAGMAREACWRWHGIGDADVQTDWHTDPQYSSGANVDGNKQGTPEETLEKCAITYETKNKTCTFRFTMTTPASEWETAIESQAGHSSSTGKFDPALGNIGASFLRQHSDGPDTIVAVSYKVPGREVRLAAVDENGAIRVAQSGGGAGLSDFTLSEFRFHNVLPDELKTWQLQTRIRTEETIEFRNVSLEPGQETEVQIVNVPQAPPTVVTGTLQLTTAAPVSAEEARKASQKRYEHTQSLLKQLSEQHGYKLGEDESLKYVPESENKPRQELQQTISNSMSLGGWMSQPGEQEEKYEPCLLLFEQTSAGDLRWASSHNGISTLTDVLEHVLELKRHQIECPPGLLMTYLPGDWVVSWNPQEPHEWSDAELTAFEKILNEEKNLGVKVAWKTVKRPALVVTGEYKASPKKSEFVSGEVAKRADGSFEIPARRSDIAQSVGTHEELLQAIGEVLMLPVVDEATVRPTKPDFFWSHTGDPVAGQERLKPADEDRVLKALNEQLGYEFRIEPREVKLLSIEQIEP